MRPRLGNGWLTVLATMLLAAAACSRTPPPAPAAAAAPTPAQRLASADALVRAGCLDCLLDAYGQYDLLRTLPAGREAGTSGAVRAAALIALRERELGMVDDGYLPRARTLLASTPDQPSWLAQMLDIIAVMPLGGITRPPSSDIDLDRNRVMRINHDAWGARLKELAPVDELAAYLWLSFSCGATDSRFETLDELAAPADVFRDTPLIQFRRSWCHAFQGPELEALLKRDPRFVEINYLFGRQDVSLLVLGHGKIDEAEQYFDTAYAWHPAWPSLTQSIANLAMTGEEFERAATFYDRTLALEPHAVDALLGKARALTYQGRNVEAIATVDQLLGERWNLGEARYWRAMNESVLDRNDEAWTDVEAADKLLVNADVPKLAGLIAYRRQDLDLARAKFEIALGRNRADCEIGFYLGAISSEQRAWPRAVEVLTNTVTCLETSVQGWRDEIASIRARETPARAGCRSRVARRTSRTRSVS